MSPTAEDLTLSLAVDLIYYGAECRTCGEVRRVDLAELLERLGADFKVGDLRPRLRCAKCGGKRVIVVTLWKSDTSADGRVARWK